MSSATAGIPATTFVHASYHAIERLRERFNRQQVSQEGGRAMLVALARAGLPFGAQCSTRGGRDFMLLATIRPDNQEVVLACRRDRDRATVHVCTVLTRDEAEANIQQHGLHRRRQR